MSFTPLEYAQHLAAVLYAKHGGKTDAPHWKVGDDLQTVLLQIDNMTAGLVRPEASALYATARAGFDAGWAAALEEAALIADAYQEEAWGNAAEEAAADQIARQIREFAAIPPTPRVLANAQGGGQ